MPAGRPYGIGRGRVGPLVTKVAVFTRDRSAGSRVMRHGASPPPRPPGQRCDLAEFYDEDVTAFVARPVGADRTSTICTSLGARARSCRARGSS